jgi:hypothetical protein
MEGSCPFPDLRWCGKTKTFSVAGRSIEIGLEQAPLVFFNLFFSAFEHVKSLLIMGPNNTKNSSLKCDFHIINYE